MKADIYDTYVLTEDGHRMHFDVFLPEDSGSRSEEKAADAARDWLRGIGIEPERVQLEKCRYCHSETVRSEVREQLETQGYFILPMEGCPS